MATISQAEINRLKYKTGMSDADITAQLQSKGYTLPTTTQEAGVSIPGFQQTTTPTQTNTQTTQPTGSVSSILGELGAEDPFINRYTQEQLGLYNTPIDENAIRKQKESEFQAQIDAINAVYADKLRQEKQTSQGRLGSNRAIQARSGLMGSDFGTAQTEQVSQLNREQEQSIENERLALVNQILTQAQSSAAAEIAAKRTAREAGGKAYLDYLAGQQQRKQDKTNKAAQLLLAMGRSPQDITDAELAQAGISRQDLTLSYQTGKSAQDAAASKAQAEQEKAALDALKTQSEIDKNQADIINEALKTGRVYESGGFIFDGNTNLPIGPAQAVRKATGGGGGGGGSGTFTIDGQVYNSQLYSGLKSPTATAVRGQVSAFKSEPTVTNFNQIQEGYLLTKSISDKTTNPTDDQALIYSLAKALDPGSVVREGEYATVQKYAQSWVDAYGTGVSQALNGTGFLSEKARKNIKKTIEAKYNTSKKTYDNLYKQYEEGINSLTGRQDGAKFIKDYVVDEGEVSTPETTNNNPLGI